MTDALRVAALQYCAGGDADATLAHITPMIKAAAKDKAKLICLPEAASFLAENRNALQERAEDETNSASLRHLQEIARGLDISILIGSLMIRRADDALVNRSYLLDPDGQVQAFYDKIHMFDADVGDGKSYRESASFTAGDLLKLATCGPAHIGMSICYDVRFPALYRDLALAGATLLSIPAAFTFDSGRAHWHTLLRARAIETGCFVIAPAQCGIHADGRRTYGHAMIIGPWGEILGEATTDDNVSAAGANDDVIIADLEMDATLRARQAIPSLANARPYHR